MKTSPRNFSLYPMAWLAAFFGVGIVAAVYSSLPIPVLAAACVLCAAAGAIHHKHISAPYLVAAAFLILGALCYQVETQSVSQNRLRRLFDEGRLVSGEVIEIEGVLAGRREPAYDGAFLLLRTTAYTSNGVREQASGKVRLFAQVASEEAVREYDALNLRHGSRVRVATRLEREDRYLNPGVVRRTTILDQQGIDAVGTIKSALLIERLGDEQVFLPLAWVYEQRSALIQEFRNRFSGPTAGVLIASLLGNKYFLDKDTADVFREGGTFHVLVISGLHITFIGGLALVFVRIFTRKRLWQFSIATVFLWGYTLAVGADVPVARATLMFTILAFSHVIRRNGSLLNSLGLCALVLLAWRPSDLFAPSFQLTFASIAAIVLVAFPLIQQLRQIGSWTPTAQRPFPARVPGWVKRFCELLYWRENVWTIESSRQVWSGRLLKSPYLPWIHTRNLQTLLAYLWEGLLVSFIVQLWLLPFLVVYFHRVVPASVVLNLWVGFFIAIESISAVFAVASGYVSEALALPFTYLTHICNWLIVEAPRALGISDRVNLRMATYSGSMKWIYGAYFLPLLALSLAVFKWQPFDYFRSFERTRIYKQGLAAAGVLLAAACLTIVFHPLSAPHPDGRLRVDFLDVEQGDSALVTFPDGQTLLVDGGGRRRFRSGDNDEDNFEPDTPTIGEAVVSNFLWHKGYSEIDYILATHADADHMQGLTAVASNFGIRYAMFGRTPKENGDFAALTDVLKRREIRPEIFSAGDILSIAGVEIEFLNPVSANSPGEVSDNDDSIVLRLTFGKRKILLTGDIESRTEGVLAVSRENLAADVIKVPHHGSRTSSTQGFVAAVKPSIAVISVGKNSMFGHPHPEVVERWKTSGAEVLTTGTSGTITVSTDGTDLKVETFSTP